MTVELWNKLSGIVAIGFSFYMALIIVLWFFKQTTLLNRIGTQHGLLEGVAFLSLMTLIPDLIFQVKPRDMDLTAAGFMYTMILAIVTVIGSVWGFIAFVKWIRSHIQEV